MVLIYQIKTFFFDNASKFSPLFRLFCKFAKRNYWSHYACLSVRPHGTISSQLTDFYEISYLSIVRKYTWNFKIPTNLTRITFNFREEVSEFVTISRWIILRMRNILDIYCREKHTIYFCNFFQKISPCIRW
jgi:hypothetical protein